MKYALIVMALLSVGCAKQKVGPQGAPGAQGSQGNQGAPGIDGSNCTVSAVAASSIAPNGGSLIDCGSSQSLVLNGTNGSNGTNGTNGSNGADGSNGTNGSNGTPGTLVQPIQFCPGTPSYPSVFPEVGFCINNEIYAVYSLNNGFLTKIEVGTWASNAVGSACTFTVGPNCQVSN